MKIRFLLHDVYGRGGGVVTVTLGLAAELARTHDVELVSLLGSNAPPVHPLPDGVRVRSLVPADEDAEPLPRRLLRRWGSGRPSTLIPPAEPRYRQYDRYTDLVLRRYLRSVRDGVLVTMQPGLNIASARHGSAHCIRVAQDHRPFSGRPRGLLEAYRQHAAGLDVFLTLTRADAKRFRRMLGDRVVVRAMPNGSPPYDGPQSSQTSTTVVAAGRLARTKGFDVLVDAWARVAAVHPDWHLDIWGEGGSRAELEAQVARLGLTEQVRLRGFGTELHAEMSRASIFVLSSRAEGYPRVILEAMACGLPVVSTDCPSGPREMIDSGVDGVLVPVEDPDALGAAINAMIERGPEGRREMGRAGRERAEALSQPVVAQRWLKLFRQAAARRKDEASGS